MQREIKFRAWDKERQEMRQIQLMDWSDWWVSTGNTSEREKGLEYGERNSFKNEESDRHILMQYTGLKDRHGKEVYEGDIVKDSFGDRKGRIRYNIHLASFEISDYEGIHLLTSNNSEKFFEIIGNIYTTPELLG